MKEALASIIINDLLKMMQFFEKKKFGLTFISTLIFTFLTSHFINVTF